MNSNYELRESQNEVVVANILKLRYCSALTAVWLKNMFLQTSVCTAYDSEHADALQAKWERQQLLAPLSTKNLVIGMLQDAELVVEDALTLTLADAINWMISIEPGSYYLCTKNCAFGVVTNKPGGYYFFDINLGLIKATTKKQFARLEHFIQCDSPGLWQERCFLFKVWTDQEI